MSSISVLPYQSLQDLAKVCCDCCGQIMQKFHYHGFVLIATHNCGNLLNLHEFTKSQDCKILEGVLLK